MNIEIDGWLYELIKAGAEEKEISIKEYVKWCLNVGLAAHGKEVYDRISKTLSEVKHDFSL